MVIQMSYNVNPEAKTCQMVIQMSYRDEKLVQASLQASKGGLRADPVLRCRKKSISPQRDKMWVWRRQKCREWVQFGASQKDNVLIMVHGPQLVEGDQLIA
uniref:Uncharacterized protein n=1 Tax=Romanomermis culicivorax TaxID=13658 RepID=A0A915LB26_ROMCU